MSEPIRCAVGARSTSRALRALRSCGRLDVRLGFLLVTGTASVLSPLSGHPWDGVLWALVQVAAMAAVIWGVRSYGLTRSTPWRLIKVAVIAAWVAAMTPSGVYEAALFVQYGAAVTALLLLSVGPGGSWRTALLDAGVITMGLGIPYWTLIIDPMIDRSLLSFGELAITLAVPVFDVFMLCLVFRMALTRRWVPWLGFLVAAQLAQVLGDSAYLLEIAWGRSLQTLSDIGWLAWSVLIASAVLHPSITGEARGGGPGHGPDGGAAGGAPAATVETGRALIPAFLALALLSPVLATVGRFAFDTDLVDRPYESIMLAVATALLGGLLVLRLHGVTRLAERRAAVLDRQADQLADQAAELNALLARQHAMQRQLTHRAHHDPLTGLANRSVLNEELARAVTATGGSPPALLMLDLDGFKDINDTFGHPVGDDLLVQLAGRLTELVPAGSAPVRLGGDEFAILLPSTAGSEAGRLARQVLAAVRAPFRYGRRELHLTGSIGLLADIPVADPATALRDADLALYAAKNAGKNRIVRYDAALREARLEHGRLITCLHEALAEHRFALHYQPVVELPTGRVWAAEALLRWTPPGEPPVPPARFIPLAEETGMIVPIGAWVLDQACAHAARRFAGHGVACSVNVSGRQLCEEDFGELVIDTLRRHRLPAEALILEITESMLVTETTADTERITEVLSALRAEGVRIALDDFGTGYSSLSYLRILPVDILKIDRSFVAVLNRQGSRRTLSFTKAILDLAAALELDTIAEGVETAEQAALLEEMGCRLAQGHHFARPAREISIEQPRPGPPARRTAGRYAGQDLNSAPRSPMD